jgi:hypothetical protein
MESVNGELKINFRRYEQFVSEDPPGCVSTLRR